MRGGWVECEMVGRSVRWLFVSVRWLGGVQGGWLWGARWLVVEREVVGCGVQGG